MIEWEQPQVQWLGEVEEQQMLGNAGVVESTAGLLISVAIIAGAVWLGLYLYNK